MAQQNVAIGTNADSACSDTPQTAIMARLRPCSSKIRRPQVDDVPVLDNSFQPRRSEHAVEGQSYAPFGNVEDLDENPFGF